MFLKRQMPAIIAIGVGLFILFGHFINNPNVQGFVNNDATQWFDIIASFAIFLGALNMLKLQVLKVVKKQRNWQYSILAIFGFAFAIFAGFFFRGANYITLTDIHPQNVNKLVEYISTVQEVDDPVLMVKGIQGSLASYEIPKIFISRSSAEAFSVTISGIAKDVTLGVKPWGAHVQIKGSLFSWMFFKIFTPLSSTMFALLAFFVASASYRAFRIRNFEATLLLVAGIILMIGRVPVGELVPWWLVSTLMVFGIGALIAPLIPDKKLLFGIIIGGIVLTSGLGIFLDWNLAVNMPAILSLPNISEWIFDYPTAAGSRAIMIGIALGIIATSFRIILGIERPF